MIRLIDAGDGSAAEQLLVATPGLATARVERTDEFFVEECHAQVYAGDTALHDRAVRNRCSAAVDALLRHGADRRLANDSGSTAFDLAHWTTGRGGSGSPEARAEQQRIVDRLADTSR
jgi:hypothetical protein